MAPSNDRSASADVVLKDVEKFYGAGPNTAHVLRGVSLRVDGGDILSICGPHGAGKTALLNLIAGLELPDGGSVHIDGDDLAALPEAARDSFRLRSVGYIFQNPQLFPTFTVRENVAWPLEFLGVPWREAYQRAEAVLARAGVDAAFFERNPLELSAAEQQRVAIARALVTKPRLLLADEPTAALDARAGQAVLDLLRALNAEHDMTVVLATHNTFTASFGHRTVELRDGRIMRELGAGSDRARIVPLRPL